VEIDQSKRNDILIVGNYPKDVDADPKRCDADSKLSFPRSKAQAFRGVVAAASLSGRTLLRAEAVPKARSKDLASATCMNVESSSAIRYPPRSKCYQFAENYRQRYGCDAALPTFIYERLSQDGMTSDEIDCIGRSSCEIRPTDDGLD